MVGERGRLRVAGEGGGEKGEECKMSDLPLFNIKLKGNDGW